MSVEMGYIEIIKKKDDTPRPKTISNGIIVLPWTSDLKNKRP